MKDSLHNIFREFEKEHKAEIGFAFSDGLKCYGYKGGQRMSSCSLAKLFIFYSVLKDITGGLYGLKHQIALKVDNFVGGSGIVKYTNSDLDLSVLQLLVLMLSFSDNIAANSLLELTGITTLNERLKSLGMEHSKLNSPLMRMTPGAENITSPADIFLLQMYLFEVSKDSENQLFKLVQEVSSQCYFSQGSLNSYSESSIHKKLDKLVASRNPEGLPYYRKHSVQRTVYGRLLPFGLPLKVVFRKSGTGRNNMIDSLLVRKGHHLMFAILMVHSKKGDFYNLDGKEYQNVSDLFLKVSSLLQEYWTHQDKPGIGQAV